MALTSHALAEFFNKQRELIEAAETPFARLAVFVLPILAPMVPATFTGMHLYQLFLELFKFPGANRIAAVSAFIPALVLELLGYVGAISFLQALFKWIAGRNDGTSEKFLIPAVLNFFAYVFYLLSMWLINVSLGDYFGTPKIVNTIIGLLSFITVPTSLLAANHLAMKDHDEKEEKRHQEKRQDRLRGKMIKQGLDPFASDKMIQYQFSAPTPQKEEPKTGDWRRLSYEEKQEVVYVLTIPQIMKKYGIAESTAYLWKSKKL